MVVKKWENCNSIISKIYFKNEKENASELDDVLTGIEGEGGVQNNFHFFWFECLMGAGLYCGVVGMMLKFK